MINVGLKCPCVGKYVVGLTSTNVPRVLIVADRNSCLIVRNKQEVILFEFSKNFLFKPINIFTLLTF